MASDNGFSNIKKCFALITVMVVLSDNMKDCEGMATRMDLKRKSNAMPESAFQEAKTQQRGKGT